MDLGPVELIVLQFPGQRADPAVAGVLADVVSRGYAAVLDLVFVARTADGSLRVTDAGDNLDGVGLGSLQLPAQPLISRDDLDLIRDSSAPGHLGGGDRLRASLAAAPGRRGHGRRRPGGPARTGPARCRGGGRRGRGRVTGGRQSCPWSGTGFPGCSGRSPAATWSRSARRWRRPSTAGRRSTRSGSSIPPHTPKRSRRSRRRRPRRRPRSGPLSSTPRSGRGAQQPAAGQDDVVSRLDDLARLRDAGVLSAAEFEAAKAKLLGT